MIVKWKGIYSTTRRLKRGGPKRGTFVNLVYICQSDDNEEIVDPNDRFKFVDDLLILEIINLLSTKISSYDVYSHVSNDIPHQEHNIQLFQEK